jgi:hypothetical protein
VEEGILVGYFVSENGVFQYKRNTTSKEGILKRVTGNLPFLNFPYFHLKSDEAGRVYFLEERGGEMYWMEEEFEGVWFLFDFRLPNSSLNSILFPNYFSFSNRNYF